MRKALLIIFAISLLCSFVKAQVINDTPNLSFDTNALSIGWKLYLGDYKLNPADSSYSYSWTLKTPAQAGTRIMLIGNGPNVNDPVIACGGLYTNPKTLVARIGDPAKTERRNTLNTTAAEKLEYSFKVTTNTTLLSYKLAAVLKVPSGDTHGPLELPSYKMNITVTDADGVSYILPCSSYDSKADSLNHNLTRNIVCNSSIGSPSTDYVYQKWISGNVDLSNQIGKTVTITIINHDCLVKSGANIIAGSHDAYGYFWAETKKIELKTFSCENSDATIIAPHGFSSYTWTRSDGYPITDTKDTIVIDQAHNLAGVVYSCEMNDANSACGALTVSTTITPVKLHPDFTWVAVDAGKIQFTNTSTAEGDSITNYYWDFGDGVGYSNLKNPIYTYSEFKPFNVKLTVTSSKSCSKTFNMNVLPTKELIAKIFPPANLVYNGQTKDFTDSVNIAGLQRNKDYYIRYTNRPGTPFYNDYSAPATVGDYTATFELSYLSLLKYFMTSVPSRDFTITKAPLTVTISNVEKTYGESITLLRAAFTQDMKPLYAGDKIYELELKCDGLSDTASVGTYTIKADSAIGLGVKNYKIDFVNGALTVKPKLLNIAAIDNSKIYGVQINPTGKEFFIAPGTLVGKDTVTSVSLQCSDFDKLATVGTSQIVASGAVGSRLSNYTINYKPATMVVNKKKITVTAKKLTKVYGTPYTFTGKEYDTDLTQFVGNDSISQVKFNSTATPMRASIGDYSISFKSDSVLGYRIENYDIYPVNSIFKVEQMPVTIIANDKTKEYSDLLALSGSEFTTDKPLISGDIVLFVSLKSDGCIQTASTGKYDIQASMPFGAGISNYDFSYTSGTLDVVKKKITAAILPPAYLGYNARTKDFTATISVSNFALTRDYCIRYTNKSGSATLSYNSTTAPFEAGDYTATFELTSSSLLKYELDSTSTLTQDFTITKTPLTVTIDDQIKTYGDNINLNVIKYAFKTDMKPLFGNDRIDELMVKCDGLSDTASVRSYQIESNSIQGSGMKNYEIHFINGTLTVKPKSLSIAAIDNSKTYGDQINPTGKEFYISHGSLVGEDSVTSVTFQCNGFDKLATVGTSQIVASGAVGSRLSNYTINYKPATMLVNKKKITVTAKKLTKVYGTPYTFSGKEYDTDLTQFVGSDSIFQVKFNSTATPLKAIAGDHNITFNKDSISGYRIDNYEINPTNSTFEVKPMPVTIIANDKTKEYGDLLALSGSEFTTDKPLISGDTILVVTLKSDGCSQTASIGRHDIQAAQPIGAGISNYDFRYTTGTLDVVKKKIAAAIFPPAYMGYNARTKDFTATMSVSNFALNTDYCIRYTNKSGSNTPSYNSTTAPFKAGDYTATFELTSSSLLKYELDSTSTLTQDFIITKTPLTVSIDDQIKTYGDNINLNVLKYAFKTDMKPLFGSDRIDELLVKCGGLSDTASVKSYTIESDSTKGPGIENYAIHFINGTFTVKPKSLIITAIDNSKTYGEQINPTGKEFYIAPGSLVEEDSVTSVTFKCNGFDKLATVGTSQIVASDAVGSRLSNYTISYKPATMLINKKKITVTAKKLTKIYGTTYTFSGKEYDTDLTQFVGSDSISLVKFKSTATPMKAPVRDYSLEIDTISGYRINNYDISKVNNTFEVLPMPVTVIANDLVKSYGSLLTLNGSEFITNKPLLNGDTISFVILKSNGCSETAPVGEYEIIPSQAMGTMNYDFGYQPGKLLVVKKALSAQIYPPAYLVYNSQNKEFTATVNVAGLVKNYDYSIRYTNRTGTNTYNNVIAPSTVGDYTATFELSSLSALKYTMDTVPVRNFSITKAPLTITADNATKIYGDKLNLLNDAFKVDKKQLFGSDMIFAADFECKGLSDTASVRSYTISPIKVIGSGDENYVINYMDGTLTVTPKQLTVKAIDETKTYGDVVTPNPKDFYVDPRDLVGNDAVSSVTLASEGFSGLATIGSYPVKASNAMGTRLKNYQIQYLDGNLQVTKRKINVSAKAISKIYGSEYVFKGDEFEADLNQLITGDKITGVKLNSQGAQKKASVGEYSLSITDVSGYRLENYDIKMLNGLLFVTPKPIVVIAKNQEKEYGDVLSFAGNEFTTNIPLMNNDTISFVYLRSNGIYESAAIGEYDIVPSQVFGAGSLNYSISYQNGKLKITNKQLQVIAQNAVKEYGENDPEKKFSVYDKRGIEYIPTMFSGNIAREPGEKVGEYAITKGTLAVTPSYSYTFTQGKFTIKKALPSIDPFFTNNAGEYIMADVLGSKNGDNPEGNLNIKINPANIDNTIAVINGTGKSQVSGLPSQTVQVELNYLGDENYLPATKTMNVYAVIYHCNGGKLVAPITHFDGSESVKLENPTQDNNYKFEGWYETEDFSGIQIRRIPIATYHDVHLYAKWSVTYDDLSIVVLFNQVLAVANPLNHEFLYNSTYKWFKDGVLLGSNKQYCGFENYVPTGNYRVEIYYQSNAPIILELSHSATMQKSKVYPNPLAKESELTIYSEFAKQEGVSIEVYNMMGVRQSTITTERSSEKFMLNGFANAGIYIIRLIQNGDIKETHKVIVED